MGFFRRKPKIEEETPPDPSTLPAETPADFFNRGMFFYSHHQYDRAIQDFNAALRDNPDLIDPVYGLGLVYKAQQKYPEAIQTFTRVLELLEKGKMDDNPDRRLMLTRISKSHIQSLEQMLMGDSQ
jgi:tetratricopeptide (TPR) repeat protein